MSYFERKPAVSGLFYAAHFEELLNDIKSLFLDSRFGPGALPPSNKSRRIYGIVVPHAGYSYSGAIAANAYYQISSLKFDTVIIVGPNHYGIGCNIATIKDGAWKTPLGSIRVNAEMADMLLENYEKVESDPLAHSRDHCIEVQIPFLQYINTNLTFLPIILNNQDKNTTAELGKVLGRLTKDRNVMLIGSSDLTHYEPNKQAYAKDGELISSITSMNFPNFYSVLENSRVSACGYGAIATVMIASKAIGATRGKLLRYATSGDVAGDLSSVVGYSSILFE